MSKPKYKIGDKVQITNSPVPYTGYAPVGAVVTIKEITSNFIYWFEEYPHGAYEKNIILDCKLAKLL